MTWTRTETVKAGKPSTFTLTREWVCSKCHGRLVEKWQPRLGQHKVVCAAGCETEKFIPEGTAARIDAKARAELETVAKNYPEWDDRPPIPKDVLDRAKKALFGDDQET